MLLLVLFLLLAMVFVMLVTMTMATLVFKMMALMLKMVTMVTHAAMLVLCTVKQMYQHTSTGQDAALDPTTRTLAERIKLRREKVSGAMQLGPGLGPN